MSRRYKRKTSPSAEPTENHSPIWFDTAPATNYEPLAEEIEVETAVVGGGIVGASVAFGLSEAGHSVTLIERDRILTGITGHTTAKLTAQHGLIYNYLIETVSAVCTHQGCHVKRNDAERSWDCPCHGSRFDYDGRVIDTPAVSDLSQIGGSTDSSD